MKIAITQVDGVSVNGPTDDYNVIVPADADVPYTSSLELADRPYQTPTVNNQTYGARTISVLIYPGGFAPEPAQWVAGVNALFSPHIMNPRLLRGEFDDTLVETEFHVSDLQPGPALGTYTATLVLPNANWRSVARTVTTAQTFVVGGNRPAKPVITFTPNVPVYRVRVTVTDPIGRGLVNHIFKVGPFNSTGRGATGLTQYDVFVGGARVPFYLVGPNTTSTFVWVRLNLPAYGSEIVDIYFGSSVANGVTPNALNMASLNPSVSTNTSWYWDSITTAFDNPAVTGAWHYGRRATNGYQELSGTTSYLYPESAHGSRTGYDALMISTGIKTGGGVNFSGLTVTPSSTGIYYEVYVRAPNSATWTLAISGNAVHNGQMTLPGVTQIAIAPRAGAAAGQNLAITKPGAYVQLNLDATEVPSQSISTIQTAYYLDGVITNSTTGDQLALTNVYTDGAIVINTEYKTISPDAGLYGSILPSNPYNWFDLPPGSVTRTGLAGTSSTALDYADTWAV